MVHMRCQHLHSEVRQVQLLWRAILTTRNCQTRHVSKLSTRLKKVSHSLNDSVDPILERQQQQQKLTGKRRIPVHVSAQVNKHMIPSKHVQAIHSHLQKEEFEQAWRLFDASATSTTYIPSLTAHKLLTSLYVSVQSHLPQLFLDFGKLGTLYFTRLDTLSLLVRQSRMPKWNPSEFCTVIELYGRLNQLTRAETLFRNMAHYCDTPQPTVQVYNSLLLIHVRRLKHMDELGQRRSLSKLKTLELEMTRKGLINTTSYNLLLSAQVKTHNIEGAEKLFRKIDSPDRTTYNILLNGYLKECKNNKDKEASNVLMEKVIQTGMKPNKKTFIGIMDGLADQVIRHARLKEFGDVEATTQSVSNLYKVMLQSGHTPDTETVNTLLKCYTAANDFDHIETLVASLAFPEKKSGCGNCGCGNSKAPAVIVEEKPKIKPDTYTFNMLIKHALSNENTDQAFQMYDTMVTLKLVPDTTTYGEFIRYYAQMGQVEESIKYYDVMRKKGISANNFIYNILLNCSLKYPQHADLIQPHLNAMVADGSATLDTVSQNTLLAKFTNNDDDDTNFERYTDLLAQNVFSTGVPLTTRTYNTILQSAGQFYKKTPHRTSLAEIMQALDTSHLHPDVYTFALSLRNATYEGDMVKAETIYKEMTDAGVKPNLYVFSHLIYGYANAGNMDKAEDILHGMSAAPYNISPTAINYAPLIKGYSDHAEYEKAHALFRDMMDKHIKADLVIYTILARMFLDSGNEKGAIDLLEGTSKTGIPIDAASLTMLAEAYAKEESPNIAKIGAIYALLKKNKWMDSKAITTLIKSYDRMRYPEGAWELWNEFKKDKRKLNTYHYNALLTCLTREVKAWYPITKMVFGELSQSHTKPDMCTYNLMIWGAYSMCDFETIRSLWNDLDQSKPLLVRNYFAVMSAMVSDHLNEDARKVYQAYQALPESPPSSSAMWVDMIHNLAKNQGFISE